MKISLEVKDAPYSAVQIANEFIVRGVRDKIDDMTNMKIQKLVYFAHGYYLAIYGRPLIRENFVAWKHGPVVRQLYKKFKEEETQQGWGCLHKYDAPLPEKDEKDEKDVVFSQISENTDVIGVINSVWEVCKHHDAYYLSFMTHKPNSPWTAAFNKEGRNARISDSEIACYFQSLINVN